MATKKISTRNRDEDLVNTETADVVAETSPLAAPDQEMELDQNTVQQAERIPELVKLTDWENPPTLLNLKQDLMDASTVHDAHVQRVDAWLAALKGEDPRVSALPEGRSKIVPKLIRKQAEWRYAALAEPFLATEDLFNVKPVTWEDKRAAVQNQLVLNHQINNKIDKIKFINDYVRAAVDEGTVVVRVGWEFHEEAYDADVPDVQYVVNSEFAPTIAFLDQLKQKDPVRYHQEVPEELKTAHQTSYDQGVPVEPQIIGGKTEKRTRTVYNCPTVEVCDYRNVIIDPTAMGDIDKASFVIYKFESSLSQLKKDRKYKNLDHINISNNTILGVADSSIGVSTANFNFSDEPRKKIIVYEYWGYWDIDGTGIVKPFVATWVGDTLIRMEVTPFPDNKLPFVLEQYLPVRRANYGEPDGELLQDNQKIIGAVTRGMIDILGRSANGQTGMRKDMLDATNKRKWEKGEDYEYNSNIDPRVGVYMHTFPEIPQSAQFMLQLMNMEAESLTGVKSFSQGVSGQSLGDVAAGVRGALDAASKRELGILRRLSGGIIKVGRKFISMNSEFLSEQEIIRITNDDFVMVRRDDLAGEFDLKLSISTAEEDDNQARELAFMLQTMGPNEDPGMRKLLLSEIARLRKMPDLAKRIESYQPQPDPVQQQIQELTVRKLAAEVQELESKALLNQAKAGTEQVTAGQIQSDTDQKNLDFVEQESGVKQQRDLQRVAEQARSQAQLAQVQSQLKRQEQAENHEIDFIKQYKLNKVKKVAV